MKPFRFVPHRKGLRFYNAKSKKNRKTWAFVLGGVLLAVAVALVLVLLPKEQPSPQPPAPPVVDETTSQPSTPVEPEVPSWAPFTSEKLKEAYDENHDVVGWLTLPGCEIDNRVFQSWDNDYYLRRNEAGDYDVWGCYFLDYINVISENKALTDPVNIIYGHSLLDDPESERFSKLKRYHNSEFADANRVITFSLLEKELQFEVFAACNIPITIDYIDPRPDDEKYRATLDFMLDNSVFDFGVDVGVDDQILILSTCTSDENVRFVVAGRLTAE